MNLPPSPRPKPKPKPVAKTIHLYRLQRPVISLQNAMIGALLVQASGARAFPWVGWDAE